MASTEATTIASITRPLVLALREYGCDDVEIYSRAGLDPYPQNPAELRYPADRLDRVWSLAEECTGDPCFGIAVAEKMQPQALYGIGFAWVSSDTLYDGLKRLVRYQRLISTRSDITLEEVDGLVEVSVRVAGDATDAWHVHPMVYDAASGMLLRMCRLALGEDFDPCQVSLQRQPPPCIQRFHDYFRAPVTFGADRNVLYFRPETLVASLPHASPELARVNDQVVIDYLSQFEKGNVSMRVRSQIIELLPAGQPTQRGVAASLGMSVRNLQRKLHDEGFSFTSLLEEVRRELALQYLNQRHRSIGEITYLLGFSEPSNFTRAFRRWSGTSPNAFRQRADH
jgi:AraC-like DNA-binding protein